MEFTGKIRSFFDGENVEGEGVIAGDAWTRKVSFSGSASARGAEFLLDGLPVDGGTDAHEELEDFFTGLWPDVDGPSWEADVARNVVVSTRALPEVER